MPCTTWISSDRGKISLHSLSDDEVYVRLRQAEQERAVITRQIRAEVTAQGWDEDEEGTRELDAEVYRQVGAHKPAAALYQTIEALFQEALRRRPIQQKLALVRHVLDGTIGDVVARRNWEAQTLPDGFGSIDVCN